MYESSPHVSQASGSHLFYTSQAASSHMFDTSQASGSHVFYMSQASGSHVFDRSQAAGSHMFDMSQASGSHVFDTSQLLCPPRGWHWCAGRPATVWTQDGGEAEALPAIEVAKGEGDHEHRPPCIAP